MAKPVIKNLYGATNAYTPINNPVLRLSFDLFDVEENIVDILKFQYALETEMLVPVPSDTIYLNGWTFTKKPANDILYVRLTRQSSNLYVVDIYNDIYYAEKIATGSGGPEENIVFTEIAEYATGISGSVNKNSALLALDGDIYDLTLVNNTVWHEATVLAGTQSKTGLQTRVAGRNYIMYWDIATDLAVNVNQQYCFRLQAQETNGNPVNEISIIKSCFFNVLKQRQIFTIVSGSYTNKRLYDFGVSLSYGTATKYKVAETAESLSSLSWQALVGNTGKITWTTATQQQKTFYVQLADDYLNKSGVISAMIVYHTDAPSDLYLKVTGTVGNGYYTGVVLNNSGSFDLSNEVTLDLYAKDLTAIEYYVDGNVLDGSNIRTWKSFDAENNSIVVNLSAAEGVFLGNDSNNAIIVTFRDLAGNTSTIQKTICFNTKIYKTSNKNLKTPDSSYDHQLMEVTTSGDGIIIPRSVTTAGEYVRAWEDIFYPVTHCYPKNPDGGINVAESIALNGTSNSQYGAVLLSSGQIVYDAEGRVTTVDWKKDNTKNYLNMESSYEDVNGVGLRYWVIDNTGYGEFALEFEHFNLDSDSYGPPYNKISPYRGDCLVIYDASADGCVTPTVGLYGKIEYKLAESTKLVELQAYSGSGDKVFSLTTGTTMNASTNGAFSTPKITTTTKICVILYSDASITKSGFKIKAGAKHVTEWKNFHIDERNGEVWVHKYPYGSSLTSDLRAIYNYYETNVNINYDDGEVVFETMPVGEVKATYTYYNYNANEKPETRTFVFANDDFVDYADVNVYALPSGIIPIKNELYLPPTVVTYPLAQHDTGKITSKYSVDKDRGIIEFVDGTLELGNVYAFIPFGRLFSDYQCHDYLRLTNDGYGGLTFYDETIVADTTPQYKDYTYCDIKLINEGDAVLEAGKIKFLPRGYDNNGDGVIDQVLDINRPWDVQKGTPAETYEKVACEINGSYIWAQTCTKAQAITVLTQWQNRGFGFDVYPRQIIYGRIVWVLGGTSGTSYPSTTSGKKCFSGEIEGKFYNVSI